ncbi:MAG: hypothetical protein JXR13_07140 [Thalassovita sp.]
MGGTLVSNPLLKPVTTSNATWSKHFKDENYGSEDVYTDIYMKVVETNLTRAGKGCENYGRLNAFLNNIFINERDETLNLALIVSENDLGKVTAASLENSRKTGIVYDILSFQHTIQNKKCTASISSSGSRHIARVRADHKKPLRFSLVYLSDVSSSPMGRFVAAEDGTSPAGELVGTLLNGRIGHYADELRDIAKHIVLNKETSRVRNEAISVFPLNEKGNAVADDNKLIFDVVINGERLAKIEIYQSDDIPVLGDVQGKKSFPAALKGLKVAEPGNRAKNDDTLWNKLGPARLPEIVNGSAYETFDKTVTACRGMETFFADYEIPNRTMERLQALLLKEFVHEATAIELARSKASVKGLNACLDQDARKRHADIIPQLLAASVETANTRAAASASVGTCMSLAPNGMTHGEITYATVAAAEAQLSNLSKPADIRDGIYFDEIKVGTEASPSIESVRKDLSRSHTCHMWSNLNDDPQGIRTNPTCEFVYLARTNSHKKDRFWVTVRAKTAPGQIPVPVAFKLGADISDYVTEAAATAMPHCVKYAKPYYE